jgi:glycine/D-amino acid oxidase-like deaminating enzyme
VTDTPAPARRVPAVLVAGAGLLGASVAYHLAAAGAEVTILEMDRPGGGTSGSSFAWTNAQDKNPAAYFALNAAGVAAYPELAAALGGDWYHPGGDLAIARGAGIARLRERVERHRAIGYPATILDRAGLAALEPGLSLGSEEVLAVHWEREAWIDAPRLVERLLAAARARGARLLTKVKVSELEVVGSHVRHVRLATGDHLTADLVLVAAGPATELLARRTGVALPMAPSPGLLAISAPIGGGVGRVVHAGDVAVRPDGEGRLMASSREIDAQLDPAIREIGPDAEPCAELFRRAARLVPALGSDGFAGFASARIGIRSVPADGLPAAGFAPGVENAYFLASHSGATLAPVLGRLVAAELLGDPQAELEPYRLERFAAGPATA